MSSLDVTFQVEEQVAVDDVLSCRVRTCKLLSSRSTDLSLQVGRSGEVRMRTAGTTYCGDCQPGEPGFDERSLQDFWLRCLTTTWIIGISAVLVFIERTESDRALPRSPGRSADPDRICASPAKRCQPPLLVETCQRFASRRITEYGSSIPRIPPINSLAEFTACLHPPSTSETVAVQTEEEGPVVTTISEWWVRGTYRGLCCIRGPNAQT
jgi:hypothetical protein